jgi:hypothetical protein
MAADATIRPESNAHIALQTQHISLTRLSMAANGDAAFVAEVDRDQETRLRSQPSTSQTRVPIYMPPQSKKPGFTAQHDESDDEDAPLLSPSAHGYGSADGDSHNGSDNGDEDIEWSGETELRRLPWWNRPSVRQSANYHTCPTFAYSS